VLNAGTGVLTNSPNALKTIGANSAINLSYRRGVMSLFNPNKNGTNRYSWDPVWLGRGDTSMDVRGTQAVSTGARERFTLPSGQTTFTVNLPPSYGDNVTGFASGPTLETATGSPAPQGLKFFWVTLLNRYGESSVGYTYGDTSLAPITTNALRSVNIGANQQVRIGFTNLGAGAIFFTRRVYVGERRGIPQYYYDLPGTTTSWVFDGTGGGLPADVPPKQGISGLPSLQEPDANYFVEVDNTLRAQNGYEITSQSATSFTITFGAALGADRVLGFRTMRY
jgi:hypothetical protein